MNRALVEQVVNAVLYEGHILYPYRPSSKKNRQRFTFGRVYPQAYSVAQKGAEPCFMQTECLALALREGEETGEGFMNITVRFLQPLAREIGAAREPAGEIEWVPELRVDGNRYQTWHEAIERTVEVNWPIVESSARYRHEFQFPASRTWEPIRGTDEKVRGVILRWHEAVAGILEIGSERIGDSLLKFRIRILNETPVPDADLENKEAILMRTFASTHTILHREGGEFVSLLDPPPPYGPAAAQCKSVGTWPVLVGDETRDERDTLLSSPIILYDYPKIAPESPGDLFDGTEIDEILTLRVMTMTAGEKAEMRAVDDHARRILERTEEISMDHLLKLHGTMREVQTTRARAPACEEFFNPATPVEAVTVEGVPLKVGDRVRICPKSRADVMDMALAGKIGIIEAIEHDVEGRLHFALVIEDDPGREFGMTRCPGHRFFYALDEIGLLKEGE